MTTGSGDPIHLGPGEGRRYAMGKLTATFKADEDETGCRYAVSEWRMEPGFSGVGAHSHDANDELFFVLDGEAELLVGTEWQRARAASFLRIPAGITRDFRNRSRIPATLLNVFLPGGFERDMPAIVQWFSEHPDEGDT